MYQIPSPMHGYAAVAVAFWFYVGLAGAVVVAAGEFGLPRAYLVYAFLFVALVLLKPFLPVFRRLLPTASHEG